MGTRKTDKFSRTIPYDDDGITNDSWVLRYISKTQLKAIEGGFRVTSGAFSPSSKNQDFYQGMSVDSLALMKQDGFDPSLRLTPDHAGIVKLQVSALRKLGLQVGLDPLPDNPYHCGVWNVKGSHQRKIRSIAEWLNAPIFDEN